MWIACGGSDGTIRIWNALTGEQTNRFSAHRGEVNVVSWDPAGTRIMSGGWDGTLLVWDMVSAPKVAGIGFGPLRAPRGAMSQQ